MKKAQLFKLFQPVDLMIRAEIVGCAEISQGEYKYLVRYASEGRSTTDWFPESALVATPVDSSATAAPQGGAQ
jgi:hypothetical protein